jgi:hypothetical protein
MTLKLKFVIITALALLACATIQVSNKESAGKGADDTMKRHYQGRFAIAVPVDMELKLSSSKLRYLAIREVPWPKGVTPEQARGAEWDGFMAEVKRFALPEGTDRVIIRTDSFPDAGRWIKGIFYRNSSSRLGVWTLLMDAGPVGVWLTGDPSIVEKENVSHKMVRNIENVAKSYQPLNLKTLDGQQQIHPFYLRHGVINLPYSASEETIARFEGHPLQLSLLIEMEMDNRHEIEPMGLIKKTCGLLAAALVTPGGGVSKIRLKKREVAGMPGEEAVLKIREGKDTDLVFTWEYNGKDDSGEYPTTRINMESPDGNLNEKLKIWDEILDSMKPMFVRKK